MIIRAAFIKVPEAYDMIFGSGARDKVSRKKLNRKIAGVGKQVIFVRLGLRCG